MNPAGDPVRVPVAFFDTMQLLCPLAVLATVALGVPAVEMNVPFEGGVTATLFTAYGGERVQWGTALCAALAVVLLAVVRDAPRGSARRGLGIATALASFFAGVFVAHASYRLGFTPLSGLESIPRTAAYIGAFAGLGFALLGFARLSRFGEPAPAKPEAASP